MSTPNAEPTPSAAPDEAPDAAAAPEEAPAAPAEDGAADDGEAQDAAPAKAPIKGNAHGVAYEVEEVSSILRRLKITVPEAEVSRAMDKELRKARKRARIKGFRPGKAPMAMIKKLYGGEVQDEVLEHLVNHAFKDVVKLAELDPVAPGVIEEKAEWEPGNDFSFVARVELAPEITVANYKGIEVDKPTVRVSNADVDEQVDRIRDSNAQLVPIDGRDEAGENDIIVANIEGTFEDGEPVPMRQNEGIELDLSSELLPGMKEQLLGAKVGTTVSVELELGGSDDDDEGEQVPARKATYQVEILELKEREVPEADDDFAVDLGFESLLELRGKIREDLTKGREVESENKVRSGLLEKLLEAHPFEVPQAIIERQATAMARDLGQRLQGAGLDEDMVQQQIESAWENIWRDATFIVRRSYVLQKIADKEDIRVEQSDLDAYYERMSERNRTPVERVRARYAQKEQRDLLEAGLREDKALDLLIAEAKINEVEAEPEE